MEPGPGRRRTYLVAVEPSGSWAPDQAPRLAAILDHRLRALNSRYELKRGFSDLDPLAVELVLPGTFQRYREALVARGRPGTQIKDLILQRDGPGVLAELRRLGGHGQPAGR
jgi:hypothetical protein